MRVRFTMRAGGEHDRFASNAFEKLVGKPFKSNDSTGTLMGYKVSDDGTEVELDCELPENADVRDFVNRVWPDSSGDPQ